MIRPMPTRIPPTLPMGDWTDYLIGYHRHLHGRQVSRAMHGYRIGPVERRGAQCLDRWHRKGEGEG